MDNNYIVAGFIGAILIFLIAKLIDYKSKYRESELRSKLRNDRIKQLLGEHSNETLVLEENLEILKDLSKLLLTQPIVYARGSMRKFYEIRANGIIYTRVRISKMNEAPKRENVQGELYYMWSANQYISKIQLVQALGYKDPKLVIKYINENLVTIEDLKKAEKGSSLKTKLRVDKPKIK